MTHQLYKAREAYLAHALEISPREEAIIDDFESWLPDDMIDAHSHSNLPEHVEYISERAFGHMLSTFPSYSIDESKYVQGILHPNKRIRNLRFAKTFQGINHRAANEYLLSQSPAGDRIAIFGLPEDSNYTIDMLSHPRASALKMYYSYLDPPATKIYEVFKPDILQEAERTRTPIVLHLPKVITESVDDVLRLKFDFPDLGVAIAHLGSSKFDVPMLQKSFDILAEETDVHLDTSLNPSAEVCLRALESFGPTRIMYGSDEPLNLIRSVPFIHPAKGQRIVSSYPYHWSDPTEHETYSHLASDAVHSHWLSLGALRKAIDVFRDGDSELTKDMIFHNNAAKLYGF